MFCRNVLLLTGVAHEMYKLYRKCSLNSLAIDIQVSDDWLIIE